MIIGAWTEGLTKEEQALYEDIQERARKNPQFLLPYERLILSMGNKLEGNDIITTELLTGEPVTA